MASPWLTQIFSGGVEGVFKGVGSLAKDVRVAITGDDPLTAEQKAALSEQLNALEAIAEAKAAEFDTAQMQGQVDLLKIDQASPSIFKSGWRPTVGWVCAAGLAYTFLLQPILPWGLAVIPTFWGGEARTIPPLPALEMDVLMTMLTGMLGLGGMRTFEKVRGKHG